MSLVDILLGQRDFSNLQELKNRIASLEAIESNSINTMPLLKTRVQTTWLLCSPNYLYCALDDKRRQQPIIKWKIPLKDILAGRNLKIKLNIRDDFKNPKNFGRVDFGVQHKNWLYSKSLYPSTSKLRSKFIQLVNRN